MDAPARTQTASVHSGELPRSVYLAIVGLACLPIGLLWDISHHSTIGRDTFWTPAHIIIQLGGIVPALLFASIALKTTFRGTEHERNAAVSFWGFRAPLGVWVTIWGAIAMMTSAPFDDWWHNRYGLDVKIISPPHAVLGLGMFAVGMGVLLFVFSSQNRSSSEKRTRSGLFCALAVGVMIAMWADFTTEYTWPNLQHGSHFYAVVSTPFPLLLLLAARASRVRAGATIAAATYMLIYIGMILVLPLFPAQPKLAPVYHPVDHMVPPAFPLLLIVPAVAIDVIHGWLTRWTETSTSAPVPRPRWWRDWLLALLFAAVYLAIMFAVQWPFSTFLLSDAADNRFFARSGHWPYFAQPGDWMNEFFGFKNDPITFKGIALAFLRAFISARVGLLLGNYLLRLKR
ncbi:MAG TPA: hypothetical protein VJW76_00240 [Verrucomicrobiae bacterium]|nr:hypothetical protein [Verrucomicrobiae bacterium]